MATMISNLDLLRRVPLLSSLTFTQAQIISTVVGKVSYRRGDVLVEQNQRSDMLFILLTGRVRVVSTDSSGRQLYRNTLSVGNFFDEISLVDEKPHAATVVAEIKTDVLTLPRVDFLNCLQQNGIFAMSIINQLACRLRQADQKIEFFAYKNVQSRVRQILVERALPSFDGSLVVTERITRQDLARMVGASREMVSRVMKDMELKGFIKTDELSHITISDSLLEQIA